MHKQYFIDQYESEGEEILIKFIVISNSRGKNGSNMQILINRNLKC